jgi:transposase
MTRLADSADGVIGVDTHRDTLAFGQTQVQGQRCWAVKDAGSYGAGLTAFLQARGELVVEIGRPKRPARRTGAKSDALGAVRGAREALACDHPVTPRRGGVREALWVRLATRHSARRAKVSAIARAAGEGSVVPDAIGPELVRHGQ